MSEKWTLGEWRTTPTITTQNDLPCIVDELGLIIAECWDDGHSMEECEANAHLLSSAKALYEALEKARNTLAGCGMNKIAADICDAALSRARGEG